MAEDIKRAKQQPPEDDLPDAPAPGGDEPVRDPTDASEAKPRPAVKPKQVEKLKPKPLGKRKAIGVPKPFRPSHLAAMIAEYKAENNIDPGDLRLRPARFLEAHGLPKPKRKIAVQGTLDGVTLEVREFEAYDESDASNQYVGAMRIKASEIHKVRFSHVVRAQ